MIANASDAWIVLDNDDNKLDMILIIYTLIYQKFNNLLLYYSNNGFKNWPV
jgi:hypothetical protein